MGVHVASEGSFVDSIGFRVVFGGSGVNDNEDTLIMLSLCVSLIVKLCVEWLSVVANTSSNTSSTRSVIYSRHHYLFQSAATSTSW